MVFLFFCSNLSQLFTGKWLGSRQICCNWATKGATGNDDNMSSDSKSVVELTNGASETSHLELEMGSKPVDRKR